MTAPTDGLQGRLGVNAVNWADEFLTHFDFAEVSGDRDARWEMVAWFGGAIEAGLRRHDDTYERHSPWQWMKPYFYVSAVLLVVGAALMMWAGDWTCGGFSLCLGFIAVALPSAWNLWYQVGFQDGWQEAPRLPGPEVSS